MREFSCIVALDRKNGIAKDGDIPWYIKEDMKYFSKTTKATEDPDKLNAVIMGRKTWETIPDKFRPLPGRYNIILTRQETANINDSTGLVCVLNSFEDALEEVSSLACIENIFCMGGGQVYAEAMEMKECTELLLTRVEGDYECDTFFPEFEDKYELQFFTEVFTTKHGCKYSFEEWE